MCNWNWAYQNGQNAGIERSINHDNPFSHPPKNSFAGVCSRAYSICSSSSTHRGLWVTKVVFLAVSLLIVVYILISLILGDWYIFKGGNSVNFCFCSVLKWVYSKRKEFASKESKFFPLRTDPFSEGIGEQECKQEVTKVVSLVRNGGWSTMRFLSP